MNNESSNQQNDQLNSLLNDTG